MPPQRFEIIPLSPRHENPYALRAVTAHLSIVFEDSVQFVCQDDVPICDADGCYLIEVHDINAARRVPRILQSHGLGALPLE